MLPKDLTPAIIEKLKQTARANPAGAIPPDFDPNNFVFHSTNGLTVVVTFDTYNEPCFHVSMSFPRRLPSDDEAKEVLAAFFGSSDQARKVLKPEGTGSD